MDKIVAFSQNIISNLERYLKREVHITTTLIGLIYFFLSIDVFGKVDKVDPLRMKFDVNS